MIMAQPASLDILLGAVSGALARVAARSDNPVTPDLVPVLSQAILDEAVRDPAVQHATNSEPWYASRVTWGAMIAALAPIAGLVLGQTVTADDQASLVEIATAAGTLLGAGIALYGRWVAKAPIGAK
jgi:hypothetical protein